jgi:hypothetical protein
VDSAGNLYIADSYNNRIREVSNGAIITVAGGAPPVGPIPITGPGLPPYGGYGGYGGDGGPATSVQLYDSTGVTVDSTGDLYIADSYNGRIREVSKGVITNVAGEGKAQVMEHFPAYEFQKCVTCYDGDLGKRSFSWAKTVRLTMHAPWSGLPTVRPPRLQTGQSD